MGEDLPITRLSISQKLCNLAFKLQTAFAIYFYRRKLLVLCIARETHLFALIRRYSIFESIEILELTENSPLIRSLCREFSLCCCLFG